MSTAESVMEQLQELIDKANAKTGRTDTDLTTAVDALIAGYGTEGGETECSHASTYDGNFTCEDGDTSHNYQIICSDCGAIISDSERGDHVDDNGDGVCDLCGSDAHEGRDYRYIYNGDGSHKTERYCTDCGQTVWEETSTCSTEETITANTDGTHTVRNVCSVCGGVISEQTADCTDEDGDGLCDVCGSAVETVCSHEDTSTGWTYHGDGTHTEKTICTACKAVLSEQTVACTDENNDGLCDVCHGELKSGIWSYAAGELSGKQQYKIIVNMNGALAWQTGNENVGVGATSGETAAEMPTFVVYAIPIPSLATKFTLTLNDSKVTEVTALLFKGTASVVTDSSELTGTLTNGIFSKTIEAGAWDYILFNFTREYTSYYENQSTLVFE